MGSALPPSHAMNSIEEAKRRRHAGLSGGYDFKPLGFETTGIFGANAKEFVTEVGHRMVLHTGYRHESALESGDCRG